MLIERWRQHYNRIRPHSSLGYRPPAPEALALPAMTGYEDLGGSAPEPPASFPSQEAGPGLLSRDDGLT